MRLAVASGAPGLTGPLTGPLTGIYDPSGMGSMLFAVLAVAAQLDRDYIREKTLEGQRAGAAKGNHGGRPKVIDDDMLLFAQALKDKGTPVPGIARKLVIKSGKNAGQHPSAASLYRAFAEAGEAGTAAVTGDGYPSARVPPASARTAIRSPPARRGSASGWSPRAGRSGKGTGHDPRAGRRSAAASTVWRWSASYCWSGPRSCLRPGRSCSPSMPRPPAAASGSPFSLSASCWPVPSRRSW